jgi:hypothetical protein
LHGKAGPGGQALLDKPAGGTSDDWRGTAADPERAGVGGEAFRLKRQAGTVGSGRQNGCEPEMKAAGSDAMEAGCAGGAVRLAAGLDMVRQVGVRGRGGETGRRSQIDFKPGADPMAMNLDHSRQESEEQDRSGDLRERP